MPLSLFSPLPLLHSFPSTVATKATVPRIRATPSKFRLSVVKATPENKGSSDEDPGFNPFGFVTDNPSSRSAIQLPESPAEDGNVGQMLYVSSPNYVPFQNLFTFELKNCILENLLKLKWIKTAARLYSRAVLLIVEIPVFVV